MEAERLLGDPCVVLMRPCYVRMRPMKGRLNLNLLVALDVLLEHGSVSAAAARLGMSQSGLSHALAELRALFGDDLLVRSGDRMVPTPKAEDLREPLAVAIRALERVVAGEAQFSPATSQRTFVVAMRDQFVAVLGPELLLRVRDGARSIALQMVPYDRAQLAERLASGAVDLAVGVDPPEADGLKRRLLYREVLACLVREGHPLGRMTLRDYAAAEHIVIEAHGGYRGAIDELLAAEGLTRKVVVRVPYFLAAPILVARTDLVLTVPSRVAELYAAMLPLRRVEPPGSLRGFDVHAVWHTRFDRDAAVRWLRKCVVEAAAAIGSPDVPRQPGA
jgi:DNA-binding transcriptional LysR family regulator